MSFRKIGEAINISPLDIQAPETAIPLVEMSVLEEMRKTAAELKRIAPKAEDFLYFSAIFMHAAEASTINEDGTPKMTRLGKPIEAHWEKRGASWRWVCSDPSIKAYKNSNGDIFPEEELIKAYKKWIGRPLCIDHKSSSVDHVRGFIVDTYYDRKLKRVIGLCALDKFNYPDLARKVSTGYSNSVSMGTAVAEAICYDCGTVAKTEHDFCNHMRTKSSYGEINVGLSPIELSIVVNGADPAAKIKHIIAAANSLSTYVSQKEEELKKLSNKVYTATINVASDDSTNESNIDGVQNENISLHGNSLEELKSNIEEAFDRLQSLNSVSNDDFSLKDANDTAYSQTGSSISMTESEFPGTNFNLAPPSDRFASTQDLQQQLTEIKSSIENKLAHMQQDLNLLTTKEERMSGKNDTMDKKAYFQGGGGVNEPTPGDRKYAVDPLNEEDRNHEDKQMVGQKPFPDVGPVDGMYPGYDSFPTGELERKKMLARAEVEERALRRAAVIDNVKKAYFNNGQDAKNPNTPTPHQRKYTVDPLNEDDRNNEDKQMVGQKPFPDVGAVDGLHPSPASVDQKDELKRKEMLRRAGLKARFVPVKTATGGIDYAKGTWQVFSDDKLILSKTVEEITNGRSEALYSAVASEAFAKDLIAKVKQAGADKVSALYTVAQMPPPAPMGDTSALPDMSESANDNGKEGDPKETAVDLSEKVRDLSSDLVEAVRALTGEEAEMGANEESPALPAAATDDSKISTAELIEMKHSIISPLISAMQEKVAELNDNATELDSLTVLYNDGTVNKSNKGFVDGLLETAISDARMTLASSFELLGAFTKFADGADAIEKRAKQEKAALNKQANEGAVDMGLGNKEIMGMLGDQAAPKEADTLSAMLADDLDVVNAEDADLNDAIMTNDPAAAAQIAKENPGVDVEVKKASLETKADRQLARAKLAAEMKWNPILKEFHPKDHALPGHLDTKPSDNLEVVENIAETHEKMLDVATAPPSVRKQASEIQALVKAGKLNPKDLDLLVANGVDPEAVKYWKDFYGEMGPEGKEFATELVKEHAKAQAEEDKAVYKVKIARAYELAYEMQECELIPNNKSARESQVAEIMTWNDQGFESMKKVLARQSTSLKKSASANGRMPQVGLFGQEDHQVSAQKSDHDLLVAAFSGSKAKRMF